MSLLIDTNVYSAFRRGDKRVGERVRSAEELVLSVVVVGELLHGFRAGSRYERNRRELDAFLTSPLVRFAPVGMGTADRFGRVAAALRRAGTPIPTNDIWIAAHALELGVDLLSFDSHFGHVEGLTWLDPATPP